LLGAAALQGHLERGWLWAWAMLLLTFVAFRASGVWAAGRLAVQVGGLVRCACWKASCACLRIRCGSRG